MDKVKFLKDVEIPNLQVAGDLTVQGEAVVSNLETVVTPQNTIKLRDGATTALLSNEYTGIIAEKYDGTNNGMLVFNSTGTAYVGDQGDLQPLATRDEANKIANNSILVWDSSKQKIVDGSTKVSDITNLQTAVNNKSDKGHSHDTHTQASMSNTDLDTIKTAGWYYGYTGMTNAPAQVIAVMEVLVYNQDWIVQRFTAVNEPPKTFERHYHHGTSWSPWSVVLNTATIGTINGVAFNGNGSNMTVYGPKELPPYKKLLNTNQWYRIATISETHGFSCKLNIVSVYQYVPAGSLTLLIDTGYGVNTCSITQLNHAYLEYTNDGISKIRAVRKDGNEWYLEMYYSGSTNGNPYQVSITDINAYTVTSPVTAVDFTDGEIPDGYTAIEFEVSRYPMKANGIVSRAEQDVNGNNIVDTYMQRKSYERIENGKNLNDYHKAGFYNVKTQGVLNCPEGIGIDAALLVYPWNSEGYELQEITETAASSTTRRWVRRCYGDVNVWSPWKALISEENIEQYAPDTMPAVSAADNGKILRVVDGKWSAVALDVYKGEVM